MEGTNRGVVAHLLWDQSVSIVLSLKRNIQKLTWMNKNTVVHSNLSDIEPDCLNVSQIPYELICLPKERIKWLSSSFPLRRYSWNSKRSNNLPQKHEVNQSSNEFWVNWMTLNWVFMHFFKQITKSFLVLASQMWSFVDFLLRKLRVNIFDFGQNKMWTCCNTYGSLSLN